MSLHVEDSGTWKQVNQVWAKHSGSWKSCTDVLVNDGGTWKSVLYSPGSSNYTTAGTYSFTVPSGVTSLTVSVYGSGGGAGACDNNGDAWVGGGGGSGGYITNTSIAVTPSETLTIIVPRGGYGASYRFNSSYVYNPNWATIGWGENGGSAQLKRGGTVLVEATGGGRGGPGGGGLTQSTAGSPNGVIGQSSWTVAMGYGYTGSRLGGDNSTGYGKGGTAPGLTRGDDGGAGAVLLTW
jgi:hypothetical protein